MAIKKLNGKRDLKDSMKQEMEDYSCRQNIYRTAIIETLAHKLKEIGRQKKRVWPNVIGFKSEKVRN